MALVPLQKSPQSALLSLLPCVDIMGRKWACTRYQVCQPPKLQEIHFYLYHPACSIQLWQPELRHCWDPKKGKQSLLSQTHRPLPQCASPLPPAHLWCLGTQVWSSLCLVANREVVALLFCGFSLWLELHVESLLEQ